MVGVAFVTIIALADGGVVLFACAGAVLEVSQNSAGDLVNSCRHCSPRQVFLDRDHFINVMLAVHEGRLRQVASIVAQFLR